MSDLRARLSTGDYLVAAAIVLFAVLAISLHSSIAGLADMAVGIRQTGEEIRASGKLTADEIRSSVEGVADAVSALPLVGPGVAADVRETARRSADAVETATRENGGLLVQSGRQGEQDARSTARLVGWLAFLVPTILLLAQWIPRRLPAWRAPSAGGG